MNMKRISITSSLVAACLALVTAVAAAQDCVRLDTDPPRSSLTLKLAAYESKVAPVTYCSLQPGLTYRLTMTARSHETRSLKMVVLADGSPRYKGMRTSHFLRSLVLPGWGQAAMGQGERTAMTVVNLVSTGVSAYQRWKQWETAQNNADLYAHLLTIAQTDYWKQVLTERTELATRNEGAYEDAFYLSAAFTGWWYVDNLFQTLYISSPPKVIKGDDGVTTLRTPHVGTTRAVVQSVLWPGEGQFYKGHISRGIGFQWGVIISGLLAIDKKLLYDLRVIDYDMTIADADTTSDATEQALLFTLAEIKRNDMDKAQKQFYAWTAASAGLWLINIIDAILSTPEPDYSGRFETDLSWRSGVLYSGIKVRLP